MSEFPQTLEHCSECGAQLGRKFLIFTADDLPPKVMYPCPDCEGKAFAATPQNGEGE